ncbi:pyridoxine 5'-phosphate synthase [Oculatella sp. LEGE 06141]|uniref:pyridoxine 5'-phosphate synthase n=1 Tax=Oculatella sp. LEGE 06141 TaxID=1828648 RepID=UPI001881CF59|nr:pyridoxine 5'-phosphate synthase [Oculatella sp. LEGE 06141]MBE9177927.1 pyridoxine 5'-phosphate synthase [Oculatella sp. LEGE 06141]
MTHLSVNLNRVALLRNSRNIGIPSVTRAAKIVLDAGAYGVTVHPRPDQRHIRPGDVDELAALLASEYPQAEYNIEGNPFESPFMDIVCRVKPTQCTLVPDSPDALTSDHGWNLEQDSDRLIPIIEQLQASGIRVSLFMDADPAAMAAAQKIGADRVELYTEPYAAAFRAGTVDSILPQYAEAARAAQVVGLGVNAGHDLNLENLSRFCTIPHVLEVSIGHALMAEALEMGLFHTIKAYLEILSHGQPA